MVLRSRLEETTFSFSTEAPKRPDRRQEPRHLTILRVGTLLLDGKRELCLIRNISAGGLMAHVYSNLKTDDRVQFELKNEEPIPGKVLWAEDSNVGIEFDAPIDVEEMLANQTPRGDGWQPRRPRVEVDRLAELRVGARVYAVNTRDISQGGVKIETDHVLPAGEQAVITLEKFKPLDVVIRWYRAGEAGLEFNQLVPFHELMRWLKAG